MWLSVYVCMLGIFYTALFLPWTFIVCFLCPSHGAGIGDTDHQTHSRVQSVRMMVTNVLNALMHRVLCRETPWAQPGTGCISLSFLEGWVFDISGGRFGESCSGCQTPLIFGPCLQCVPWKTCSCQCLMPPLQPAQKLFLPMDAAGPNYWGVNQLLSPATSPSGTQPVMDGNWSEMSRSLTLEQDNSEAHCFPELPSGLKSPQELECTFLPLLCLTSLHTLPPPGNYLHLNPCRRIYSWEIRLRGQERRTCQGSLNCKGRSPWAGPWLPANLQHQQDGWNDQAWIGEEGKDLAQEGWEIIFNCLLDDIIHSVFPTGKRRGYIIAYFLAHMAWMTVSILGGFRPPLTPALLEEQSSSA